MIEVTELSTMLTDYALALESAVFAVGLWRLGHRQRQRSIRFWGLAFGGVAIAAFLGGTLHGFHRQMTGQVQWFVWDGILGAIAVASFLVLSGTILSSVSRRWQEWFIVASGGIFLTYWIGIAKADNYAYGAASYLFALVVGCVLQFTHLHRTSAFWMLAGVLISGGAIALLLSRISIPPFLNSYDLYHLTQMIALYCFYRGARELTDQQ